MALGAAAVAESSLMPPKRAEEELMLTARSLLRDTAQDATGTDAAAMFRDAIAVAITEQWKTNSTWIDRSLL